MIQQKKHKHALAALRDGARSISLMGKHALGIQGTHRT